MSDQIKDARLEVRVAEQTRDGIRRQLKDRQNETRRCDGVDPVRCRRGSPCRNSMAGSRRRSARSTSCCAITPNSIRTSSATGASLRDSRKSGDREIEVRRKAAAERPGVLPSGDPVTEQLKVALNEAEANVIKVRARLAEFEARYAQLKANAEALPKIDTEWTQLNRDYDIQKKQYESLVSRRETASMTGKLEDAGVAEFRIIDPPRVTPNPVAPNRLLLLCGSRRRVARRRSRHCVRGEPGSPDLSRWPRSARDRRPSVARHGQHDRGPGSQGKTPPFRPAVHGRDGWTRWRRMPLRSRLSYLLQRGL